MPDFSARSYQPELMDTEVFSFPEFSRYLAHLEYINRLTFAYFPTLQWLKAQGLKGTSKQWTILDAASGSGDMIRAIWCFARKNNFNVNVTGLDINPHATKAAKEKTPKGASLDFQTGDVFTYEPEIKPDYIISVQFTHHLKDDELITFIQWLDQNARCGWFINDLHRHAISYYFIKYALWLFPVHRCAKYDGPLSVAKAFTKKDWQRLLQNAGIDQSRVHIKWHFPFRYSIACRTSHIQKR